MKPLLSRKIHQYCILRYLAVAKAPWLVSIMTYYLLKNNSSTKVLCFCVDGTRRSHTEIVMSASDWMLIVLLYIKTNMITKWWNLSKYAYSYFQLFLRIFNNNFVHDNLFLVMTSYETRIIRCHNNEDTVKMEH